MRDELHVLSEAADLFASCKQMRTDKFNRRLIALINSEEFLRAMFRPNMKDGKKDEITAKITQVYDAAGKPSVIEAITEAVADYGYRDFSRATTAFLTSIVNLGVSTIDAKASDLGRAMDHDEIDQREYDRQMRKLDRFQEELGELLKYIKRCVKSDSRALARATGLPKKICQNALYTVPEYRYLDQYKVGYYLTTLLGNIYGYVDLNPDEVEDFEDIDWEKFFRVVFGKDRVCDVASLVLLEGVDRIAGYENQHIVHECWDSLTSFALKALNKAPESLREQMMELYLKRINRMLANNGIDLRIDLTTIDSLRFSNLAKTVSKYLDKFDAIMKKASAVSKAKPMSSPV